MRKRQLLKLIVGLASIFLVITAFQLFSLKHSNLGRHKYVNSYSSLVMLGHQASNKTSTITTAPILLDMAAGPVALAAEFAAGTFTILLRSVSTAEENILRKKKFINKITLNNLD